MLDVRDQKDIGFGLRLVCAGDMVATITNHGTQRAPAIARSPDPSSLLHNAIPSFCASFLLRETRSLLGLYGEYGSGGAIELRQIKREPYEDKAGGSSPPARTSGHTFPSHVSILAEEA